VKFWKNFDGWLTGALLALSATGVLFIHSASLSLKGEKAHSDEKQLLWLGVSAAVFVLISWRFDYHRLKRRGLLMWAVAIVVLLYTLLTARAIKGAKSWLRVGGFGFEPADFAKIVVAIACADLLAGREEKQLGLKLLGLLSGLVLIPFGLVVAQPALGAAMTFIPVLGVLPFIAPFPRRLLWTLAIAGLFAVSAAGSYISSHVLKQHQKDRIETFLDPEKDPAGKGYHANQARIAIGSGGLFGKGLFKGTQNQLNFLPEQHTDFIFGVICEEGGLLAVLAITALYFILFYRAYQIALAAPDALGFYLVIALTAIPLFQTLANVGMVLGLLPATGIPLPLLSYGGTSLLTFWIGFGLIQSVHRQRFGGRAE
jgi:rod shape determining protein RodA